MTIQPATIDFDDIVNQAYVHSAPVYIFPQFYYEDGYVISSEYYPPQYYAFYSDDGTLGGGWPSGGSYALSENYTNAPPAVLRRADGSSFGFHSVDVNVYQGGTATFVATFVDGTTASYTITADSDSATMETFLMPANFSGGITELELFGGDSYANFDNLEASSGPTEGDDILYGDSNANTIDGLGGNDQISGLAGDDELYGSDGDDTLNGGLGADVLNGGNGTDTASYETATVGVRAHLEAPYVNQGEAVGDQYVSIENVIGSDFNDRLSGNFASPNVLRGGDGADELEAIGASDSLYGEEGNDYLASYISSSSALMDGGDGTDFAVVNRSLDSIAYVFAFSDDVTLDDGTRLVGIERLNFTGGSGDDIVVGGDYEDVLIGSGGNDQLSGAGGDDDLRGLEGDDLLSGDDGNDFQAGGDGNDALYGGAGEDWLRGEQGDDTLVGEAGDDRLQGDDGVDTAYGDAGSDLIEGGAGEDLLDGGDDQDVIRGGDNNDLLFGGAGDDVLHGDAGDDLLYGAEGNDLLDGNDGIDTAVIDFSGMGSGVNFTVQDGTYATSQGTDTLVGIEAGEIYGSDHDDTLRGGIGGDLIFGAGGADLIYGEGGDDYLEGEDGADIIFAGAGIDELHGGSGNDSIAVVYGEGADLLDGGDDTDILFFNAFASNDSIAFDFTSGGHGGSSWLNIERLFYSGSQGAETVTGGDGNDDIHTYLGDDVIDGGGGNDVLRGSDGDDIVQGGSGDDSLFGDAHDDKLDGGDGNDFLLGGTGDDLVAGGAGDDQAYIRWDGGSDAVDGGDGSDMLIVDLQHSSTTNIFTFSSGAFAGHSWTNMEVLYFHGSHTAQDNVNGGSGDDTIFGYGGNDVLWGSQGDDVVNGGDGDDALILFRNDGSDTLDGGAGTDILSFINSTSVSLVLDFTSGGFEGSIWQNIERLQFSGSTADETVTGGSGDDYLQGNGGDDILNGGGGRDTLFGNSGNDTLDGGAGDDELWLAPGEGNDSLDGGEGNDRLVINAFALATGITFDAASGAFEGSTFTSMERTFVQGSNVDRDNLYGHDGEDIFYGFGGDDFIAGRGGADDLRGGEGDDFLAGEDGNDLVRGDAGNDYVSGGAGTNSLQGGDGDDTIEVGAADSNTADGGAGHDRLFFHSNVAGPVTFDFALGSYGGNSWINMEVLSFLGSTGDDVAIGSAGDDYMDGEAGNDLLVGGDGNDYILGNLGNDVVAGGAGNDILFGGSDTGPAFLDYGYSGDVLDYSETTAGFTVDLTLGTAAGPEIGNDMLQGFEGVIGGGGNDTVLWSANGSQSINHQFSFEGGDGIDELQATGLNGATLGGSGDGTAALDAYSSLFNQTRSMWLTSVENFILSGYGYFMVLGTFDQSTGITIQATDESSSTVDAAGLQSATAITYLGGSNSDYFATATTGADDYYDGGAGWDWIDYYFSTAGVTVNLTAGTASGSQIGTDTLLNVEGISGSQGDDLLVGDDAENAIDAWIGIDQLYGNGGDDYLAGWEGDDRLYGGDGDDQIHGGDGFTGENSGDDMLQGGAGNDLLNGGDGSDTAEFGDATSGVNINLILNSADGSETGSDTLVSIENVNGGAGNDVVSWSSYLGPTHFNGRGGIDRFQSYATSSFLMASLGGTATQMVINGLDVTTDEVESLLIYSGLDGSTLTVSGDYSALVGGVWTFSGWAAGSPADVLDASGLTSANIIEFYGNNGDDTFVMAASGANDLFYGWTGIDTADYSAATAAVTISLAAGTATGSQIGADSLVDVENATGGIGDDQLSGHSGVVNVLRGGGGNDILTANGTGDSLFGDAGDDELRALAGTSGALLNGGAGTDFALVYRGFDAIDYSFALSSDVTLADGTRLVDVERLNFVAGSGNDSITGGGLRDEITGGSGNDVLNGGAGDDSLDGGVGGDRLIGGAGNDVLSGGGDHDVLDYSGVGGGVTVNLASGVATGAQIGTDSISGFETVWGGTGNDNITGDGHANVLVGGFGADTLRGGDGDDALFGGDGADILDGGAGFDLVDYQASSAAVSVNLQNGRGSGGAATGDVLSSVEWVLGSSFGDVLVGSSVANTINGLAGNDTINGGGGIDALVGGGGSDLFQFKTVADIGNGAVRENILDFEASGAGSGSIDRLDFSAIDANTRTTRDDPFTFIGSSAFSGRAGQLRVEQTSATTATVYGDVNGDGVADFALDVTFTGTLDSSDFII